MKENDTKHQANQDDPYTADEKEPSTQANESTPTTPDQGHLYQIPTSNQFEPLSMPNTNPFEDSLPTSTLSKSKQPNNPNQTQESIEHQPNT
jgi:hypothetical protein